MRILFLVSRFPYPLEKGDKLRAFQHIINMHKCGINIILVALSDQHVKEAYIEKLRPYCSAIHILKMSKTDVAKNLALAFPRKLPLQVAYFYSKKNQRSINRIVRDEKPDAIYCQLIRTALYAKKTELPKVIDYQDAFSKGTAQRMEKAHWIYKPLFSRELKLVTEFEKRSYHWFNEHLIISDKDRKLFAVDEHLNVTVLPNGIDTGFFRPMPSEKKVDITFVGNMNYPPNVDASCFLVREIMPIVWKSLPDATVQLAGATPHRKVQQLASEKIIVTGWVDDIRDCYKLTKVFIAPMRIGTGLQNKLLEAMSMKVPCITTSISFEPLGAIENKHILVGDNASSLAKHLISLITDADLAEKIALNGFDFVTENYSMHHSSLILEEMLNRLKMRALSKSYQ